MWKVVTVVLILAACCQCADNEVLIGDARAKKRKSALKLWAIIMFFVFVKIAVFKVASFFFFYMVFQKLFYFAGLLLTYFMKQKSEKPLPMAPTMYGPPGPHTADYNTIGYSYGPPEHHTDAHYPGAEYGLPTLKEIGGTFNNWLFNKNP